MKNRFNRITTFLKKDKRYVCRRLIQEFHFRINKIRYRYPFLLKKCVNRPGLVFFGETTLSDVMRKDEVISLAENYINQKFNLLGSGEVTLTQINWSEDFKTGFVWPTKYCHDYSYNHLDLNNDVKVPWELSRLQFLPCLAQAFLITKDVKYLEKIDWYLDDWNQKNPFGYSINWACTMDVALRTISIIKTFCLLAENSIHHKILTKYNHMIFLHGVFISENLERSDINGNHYLADLVGLFWVGTYFKNQKWIKIAKSEIENEMQKQIYSDGSDFEASIPYHRLILELFFLSFRLGDLNENSFSKDFKDRLILSFKFVSRYLKPTGIAPIIGDNDNGRAFILGNEDLNDHRYLLEIGQSLFPSESILNFEVSTDYCLWLGLNLPPKNKSSDETWISENYYVKKFNNNYLFVEMSPIGLGGRGGHGHSDTGSFELMLRGVDVFVDSGCYSYTSDYKRRNEFRSTSAHNIIQLDDLELFPIFDPQNLWHLTNTIKHREMLEVENGIELSHDGFACNYKRVLRLSGANFLLTDSLCGLKDKKLFTSRFHLHPSCEAQIISKSEISIVQRGVNFRFTVKNDPKFSLNIKPCEISFHFGELQKSNLIEVSASIAGISSFLIEYELKEV